MDDKKRGRPPEPHPRVHRVQTRLTAEGHRALDEMRGKQPVSAFIRQLIVDEYRRRRKT